MTRVIPWSLALLIFLGPVSASSRPPTRPDANAKSIYAPPPGGDRTRAFFQAPADTFVLGDFPFDDHGSPDRQGWVSVDLHAAQDTFFHVDDFAGMAGWEPLEGNQSLWCGARADPCVDELCSYATLPGYGNDWAQYFESTCFDVVGDVGLRYRIRWDNEANYDFTYVEYDDCDPQNEWAYLVQPRTGVGEAVDSVVLAQSAHDGHVRFRFRFVSDGFWSDQDGSYDSEGAVVIDSIVVTDAAGLVDYQDFEAESVGASQTQDGRWLSSGHPAYGDFADLFPGTSVVQEDPCGIDPSFVWGFFKGSPYTKICGASHPDQAVVPYGPVGACSNGGSGEPYDYIHNEVWSPWLEWDRTNTGGVIPAAAVKALLEFDVYLDSCGDNYVAYTWRVRSMVDGNAGPWRSERPFYLLSPIAAWLHRSYDVTSLVDGGATSVQIALGVWDICNPLCGYYAVCHPHTHAPLFDNARLVRVDANGPAWSVAGEELFQDSFSADGTASGTVPVDVTEDTDWTAGVVPGDSAVVTVTEPVNGLATEAGGPAVYCHVHDVSPQKSGAAISGDMVRWPVVSQASGWTVLRFDSVYSGGSTVADHFCVDLNDNLYEPGDTVYYFFSARDGAGRTTYWRRDGGATTSESEAEDGAMEMTCLPANALGGMTRILYIDDFDGFGAEPFFDTAFEALGITPDRYDAPLSDGSGLGTLVSDVTAQLIPFYDAIICNSGGSSWWGVRRHFDGMYDFIRQHPDSAGLYLSGDVLALGWSRLDDPGPINLRNEYMGFGVLDGDHTHAGEPASPLVVGQPGTFFYDASADSLMAVLDCPTHSRFDVLLPGGSSFVAAAYSDNPAHGAVLAQETTNQVGGRARVVLSGFSYHAIRDDRPEEPADRVEHLRKILEWIGTDGGTPTSVPSGPHYANALAQNFPNPFNPSTTIRFQVARRARVQIHVYDVRGALVEVLSDAQWRPGWHEVRWSGRNRGGERVASGIYFCRMVAPGFSQTRKMVVLK